MARTEGAKTALDTSVIVAGLLPWHQEHEPANQAIAGLLDSSEAILLPIRTLMESFSVMTRLPSPHRLSSSAALELLRANFQGAAQLIDLRTSAYWDLLDEFAVQDVRGGAVYDAEIIECARRAGAVRIMTLNRRQFERLAPEEIEVVVPSH